MMKYILILVGVFLIAGVSAIGEGDILTQQQVNNINFSSVNLQCRQEGIQIDIWMMVINPSFSCLSLKKLDSGDYQVIRYQWDEWYRIWDYMDCRLRYSKQECVYMVKQNFLETFKNTKAGLRETLKEFQNTNDLNSGDIGFDSGELNQ